MIRIYLDANTSEALAVLRAEGFEVVRAQEVGLDEEDDIAQIKLGIRAWICAVHL